MNEQGEKVQYNEGDLVMCFGRVWEVSIEFRDRVTIYPVGRTTGGQDVSADELTKI